MTFGGNYENISAILKDLRRFMNRPDMSCTINLSINSPTGELVLIDSDTLKPLETIEHPLNNCFLIEKSVLDIISCALGNMKSNTPQIIKTDAEFIKTASLIDITDSSSPNKKSSKCTDNVYGAASSQPVILSSYNTENHFSNPASSFITVPDINAEYANPALDPDLYIIENHDLQCAAANRPTVFAIKQMAANYYLLFYRKSVYDTGVDNNFRKYLSMQPGTLVAYRYCHSVNSIRSEFANLNLSLRHNGKNELSRYQADHILQTFNSMRFM